MIVVTKGGAGSGNFGHAGRPGKIGGSAPETITAYHRTTPEAANAIRSGGFNLDKFGKGAGLGMVEEPAGIFLSVEGTQGDFEAEVAKRPELSRFTDVIKVSVPGEKIWNTDKKSLRQEFYKFREAWAKERYEIDDDTLLDAFLRVNKADIIKVVGEEAYKLTWKSKLLDYLDSEVDQKRQFAVWLNNKGYEGVSWEEGLYHVRQLVVLNPHSIQIEKERIVVKGGPGSVESISKRPILTWGPWRKSGLERTRR